MEVLVIGSGGREHALVWKIAQSGRVDRVYCAPGNAGTGQVAGAENVPIAADDIEALLSFAKEREIGLTVVGPEQALVMGIVDRFRHAGLRIFGPTAKAAEIEGSKAFCKDLLNRHNIPTANYFISNSLDVVQMVIDGRGEGPVVVKASGLAAGKGVILCKNKAEARTAAETIMGEKAFGQAGDEVVIEDFLQGQEVSVLAFTDGETVLPLDSAQDHKAAFDGDTGPNTGGMGAYSPAPVLSPELRQRVLDEILIPTVAAMRQEGRLYQGILYAGLMLTADGPKVLEFNARFGDPETQPLLMRMQSDIVPLFEACIDGTLKSHAVEWKKQPAVCVVMAAAGYPDAHEKGKVITGLDKAGAVPGVVVFHAGTRQDGPHVLTAGGRVLGVTAIADGLPAAIEAAYQAVKQISWDGLHYRTDIGKKALGSEPPSGE